MKEVRFFMSDTSTTSTCSVPRVWLRFEVNNSTEPPLLNAAPRGLPIAAFVSMTLKLSHVASGSRTQAQSFPGIYIVLENSSTSLLVRVPTVAPVGSLCDIFNVGKYASNPLIIRTKGNDGGLISPLFGTGVHDDAARETFDSSFFMSAAALRQNKHTNRNDADEALRAAIDGITPIIEEKPRGENEGSIAVRLLLRSREMLETRLDAGRANTNIHDNHDHHHIRLFSCVDTSCSSLDNVIYNAIKNAARYDTNAALVKLRETHVAVVSGVAADDIEGLGCAPMHTILSLIKAPDGWVYIALRERG